MRKICRKYVKQSGQNCFFFFQKCQTESKSNFFATKQTMQAKQTNRVKNVKNGSKMFQKHITKHLKHQNVQIDTLKWSQNGNFIIFSVSTNM